MVSQKHTSDFLHLRNNPGAMEMCCSDFPSRETCTRSASGDMLQLLTFQISCSIHYGHILPGMLPANDSTAVTGDWTLLCDARSFKNILWAWALTDHCTFLKIHCSLSLLFPNHSFVSGVRPTFYSEESLTLPLSYVLAIFSPSQEDLGACFLEDFNQCSTLILRMLTF